MDKQASIYLKNLTNALINDLKDKNIEYVDLVAYNRSKNYLINKKYFDEEE